MLSQIESRASTPARELSSLLATILYEDVEAGLRARALMESVEANMDFPAEFQLDLWRFDWLAERSLGNIALGRADRSALVVVSVGSTNVLPAGAENWLNRWVQIEQSHPLALVVLIPKDKRGDSSYHQLHERLRAMARQKGVDFFCEFFDPSAPERDVSTFAPEVADAKPSTYEQPELAGDGWNGNERFHAFPEPPAAARPVRACSTISQETLESGGGKAESRMDSPDILNSVTLLDMNPKTRRQTGLPNNCEGVVVACVDPRSAAFKAGLRVGDVIQQMDQHDVRAAADAVSLSQKAKGKNVLLRVWSQGDSRFLVVNRSLPVAHEEKRLCP
jgi:hypothetical protein